MKNVITGLMLVTLAMPVFAGDLSYNYAELGYQRVELDDVFPGTDVDGDGFGVNGSFEIGESWYINAGYSKVDFDFDIDMDQASLGVGYHVAYSPRSDFFAEVAYVYADLSVSGFGSTDEDGYGVTVGVRGMVTDVVELVGKASYVDLGEADGSSFGVGALYSASDMIAIGLFADFDEDATAYGLGVRFYFGH